MYVAFNYVHQTGIVVWISLLNLIKHLFIFTGCIETIYIFNAYIYIYRCLIYMNSENNKKEYVKFH